MDQHFGVALRAKVMSLGKQFLADLDVIVDLAIQNHPDRPIFIANRLSATRKIDDRKPGVAKQATPSQA
jgi:hypothetical protein